MGPGKAELLEAIDKTGSISAAGKTMKMSYRRAWMLVDVMNRCFAQPLVLTAKGGHQGGGAILTPFGKLVLERYRQVNLAINLTVEAYLPLFAGLLNSPESNQTTEQIADNLSEPPIKNPE